MAIASIAELERAIERLVQEHLAAHEAQVRAAVQTVATRGRSTSPRREGKGAAATKTKMEPRRSAAELASLGERFYEAVERTPGETMSVLSGQLGLSSRSLERSVSQLKKAGRVRTVGERNHTRYFPMAPPAAVVSADLEDRCEQRGR